MSLVTVEQFRKWAGTQVPAQVPDVLIQQCLDEAEAGIAADCGTTIDAITADRAAAAVAVGEEQRRANRLLARRNSPEGVAGIGDAGVIAIPSRDADSQRAVWAIRALLLIEEGIA